MSWEDQGRQGHGRFGHGTSGVETAGLVLDAAAVDEVVVRGAAAFLTGAQRGAFERFPMQPPKDPKGAKASGKPGSAQGFEDPKGGEEWVREPNGSRYGWKAKDGSVWVPTGFRGIAHGGPHWDVQHPDGSHKNVFPPKD